MELKKANYPLTISEINDIDNRFSYHAPYGDKGARHVHVRSILKVSALEVMKALPRCREQTLFLTKMEEAMMWANAAIARTDENNGGSQT